ncbi:hypothetical protein PanWU01x14_205360 [Parasponia andersonii]|uniref:Uncharacterized protein n=1 Tax=Parasponia andersonii TaxID=3476 RepID=A0A2P5BW25_PARAD|nr:hypothetical protein PanWU01x14_205360 [Parasponia andersonii]
MASFSLMLIILFSLLCADSLEELNSIAPLQSFNNGAILVSKAGRTRVSFGRRGCGNNPRNQRQSFWIRGILLFEIRKIQDTNSENYFWQAGYIVTDDETRTGNNEDWFEPACIGMEELG